MYNYTISNDELKNRNRIKRKASFAIGLCFLACLLFMLSQTFFSFFAVQFVRNISDKTILIALDISIYSLSFLSSFCLIHFVFKYIFKNDTPRFHKRYLPQRPVLYIIGTIGIGYLCNLLLNIFFSKFLNNYSIDMSMQVENAIDIVLYYVYIALLPAILEEYAFRHVILVNLLPYGKWGAILCSSLLFGIIHIDPPRVIIATVFGILLSICREYTGSLLVPIIIHFINNAVSATTTLIPRNSPFMVMISLMIYAFIFVGIFALVFYIRNGLGDKKVSLIKPHNYGFKLSLPNFLMKFALNIGIIPFVLMYLIYFYIYFLAN